MLRLIQLNKKKISTQRWILCNQSMKQCLSLSLLIWISFKNFNKNSVKIQ